METKKVLVINGPNLDMTGMREPQFYGNDTLDTINGEISAYSKKIGIDCDFFQSNCEGEIVTEIHKVLSDYDGCIINAGAYTHYSYAIYDAIKCTGKPFIEIHMSNLSKREEFRHTSVIAPACVGTIAGFGKNSYLLGISAISELI